MTRLFREGRTETVRPCTIESSQWVKAMHDESVSVSFIRPYQKCRHSLTLGMIFAFFPVCVGVCALRNERSRPIVSRCYVKLARSINEAIKMPCVVKASIVICSACTLSPNTWKWIRPSWRRCSANRGACRPLRLRTAKPPNLICPRIRTAFRPVEVSVQLPTTVTVSLTSSPARILSFSTFRPKSPRPRRYLVFSDLVPHEIADCFALLVTFAGFQPFCQSNWPSFGRHEEFVWILKSMQMQTPAGCLADNSQGLARTRKLRWMWTVSMFEITSDNEVKRRAILSRWQVAVWVARLLSGQQEDWNEPRPQRRRAKLLF